MKPNSIRQENGDLVYPITSTMFDYFPGSGYAGWCRFRLVKDHIVHLGGKMYPERVIRSLILKVK